MDPGAVLVCLAIVFLVLFTAAVLWKYYWSNK